MSETLEQLRAALAFSRSPTERAEIRKRISALLVSIAAEKNEEETITRTALAEADNPCFRRTQ